MDLLTQILSSQVRAEIFRLLFSDDKSSIYLRDLQRQSGMSIRAIQKEIAHLKELDLVVAKKDGNRLYYSANTNHPIFGEICSLVTKTSGITAQIKEALIKIEGIHSAFIFGSYARGNEKSHSDIDLIVIGDIGLRALSSLFKKITEKTQREINPHVYSVKSWREKLNKNDHFIKSILRDKKIFLIGDQDVLLS